MRHASGPLSTEEGFHWVAAMHRLLGISGSLRRDATNRKLVREAARLYGEAEYAEADIRLPLYDGDIEEGLGIPEEVRGLAERIAASDAILIAAPEYNKSISGSLKNALDWVSRVDGNPWKDRPVAVMSAAAGRGGGEVAQYAVRQALQAFRPRIVNGAPVMVAAAHSEFDGDGHLTSKSYIEALTQLMAALRAEVELLGRR